MSHSLNWFEIPVSDLNRAKKFYESIFGFEMQTMDTGEVQLVLFPSDWSQGEVGGALAYGRGYQPANNGTKVYLNGGDDLNIVLNKVEANGGKVIVPKTQISPQFGYMGAFTDTEGNWIGLHSQA